MLPRWHIFWGALLTILVFILNPRTPIIYLTTMFLSSFLIDFDHYLVAAFKSKRWSLNHAFHYHRLQDKKEKEEYRKKIFRKGDFHIFHTLEFHILIAILGYFWTPFFYVFIGMMFHSLLDVVSLIRDDRMYRREFFLTSYLLKKN